MSSDARPEDSGSAPIRARDRLVALGCVLLGLSAGAVVWVTQCAELAQQYLASYLVELSLSADNVFVFALVFIHFGVDPRRQRRLLLWGVAGAIVLRSAVIMAGIGAIGRFTWIIPAFGALILATGVRLAAGRDRRRFDPSASPAVAFITRRLPAAFAAFVALETADLIFALDSLPAVIAVTHDARIAIASNFFAILGLRSLYFVVSAALQRLRFLDAGLAAILIFAGIKMVAEPWIRVPASASLAVIAAILGVSAGASVFLRKGSQ